MFVDETVLEKAEILCDTAMTYEVSVQAFSADDYLKEFTEFFEIKNRDPKLIPSTMPFDEALRELCGDDVWWPIAEKTKSLFGEPRGVTVFEDDRSLKEELEGPDGLAPFFFVFDQLFCEYEGFTLYFVSGTNN